MDNKGVSIQHTQTRKTINFKNWFEKEESRQRLIFKQLNAFENWFIYGLKEKFLSHHKQSKTCCKMYSLKVFFL